MKEERSLPRLQKALQWNLSWTTRIQPIFSNSISSTSILILYSTVCLHNPLLKSVYSLQNFHEKLSCSSHSPCGFGLHDLPMSSPVLWTITNHITNPPTNQSINQTNKQTNQNPRSRVLLKQLTATQEIPRITAKLRCTHPCTPDCNEDSVYLITFSNISNSGTFTTIFTQLFSNPYLWFF